MEKIKQRIKKIIRRRAPEGVKLFLQTYLFPKAGFVAPKPTTALEMIYEHHKSPHSFGDKGTEHRYLKTYEKLFQGKRFDALNLLEIGVFKGHSLRMWREYFPNARIIGIDITTPELDLKGCEFYPCDATDRSALEHLFKNSQFDVIIDDGSHLIEHQFLTFKYLFPKVTPEGLYIIEDVGSVSREPDLDVRTLEEFFGPAQVYDTRRESDQYDDILMVWKK